MTDVTPACYGLSGNGGARMSEEAYGELVLDTREANDKIRRLQARIAALEKAVNRVKVELDYVLTPDGPWILVIPIGAVAALHRARVLLDKEATIVNLTP